MAKRLFCLIFLCSFISVFLACSQSSAETTDLACDHLAGALTDNNLTEVGTPFDLIDPNVAIPACESAIQSFPDVPRFKFELARAFQKANRLSEAAALYEPLASTGYPAATYNLSMMYLNGAVVNQDVAKGLQLLAKSAELGLSLAQYQLGLLYATGQHVAVDPAAARSWYEKAAMQGDAAAENELGVIYENGLGISKNIQKAAEYYRQSASKNYVLGDINLGRLLVVGLAVERDPVAAARWYAAAADQGNAQAQNELGVMYLSGVGVAQDDVKAFELYRKSASLGYSPGLANVGLMYATGRGVSQDKAEAAKWYSAAADKGNAWAQNELGVMYQNGVGVTQDDAKAFEFYRKSAALGYSPALATLGWMYANGRGVSQDKAEAAKQYAAAADKGNAWAQNELGIMYQNGVGVTQDDAKAFEFYRKSASLGFSPALANLGWMYANGRGVSQDKAEAAKWYAAAADKGNAWAQDELGLMYLNGAGISIDYGKALALFHQSSALGNADADANLGYMYHYGTGLPKDYKEAETYLRKAASEKNTYAMFQLGTMYQQGDGVPPDFVKAYIWFRLAIDGGNQAALKALAQLCANSTRYSRDMSPLLDQGHSQALNALYPQQATEPLLVLPNFLDESLRNRILRFRTDDVANRDDGDTERMIEEYVLAYVLHTDSFLSENAEYAKVALLETQAAGLKEAAQWYRKAISTDSIDALLQLGNLYLTQDPRLQTSVSVFTPLFPKLSELSTERFEGSASMAASLYEQATNRGSNAARINLATLYELGDGVPKNLDTAAALYRQALGSRFDAKAHVGLFRIASQSVWAKESVRSQSLISPQVSADDGEKSDDIVIEAIKNSPTIVVSDRTGKRIFATTLLLGQKYTAPRGRNDLFLWVTFGEVRARIGDTPIDLSDVNYHFGIKLDRHLLLAGSNFLATRNNDEDLPFDLPEETIAHSRITIEVDQSNEKAPTLYVHSKDDIIGFEERQIRVGQRFRVPDVAGLTLELQAAESPVTTINIWVDGASRFQLKAPNNCLVTLSLDPDLLRDGTASDPPNCNAWSEGAPPSPYVQSGSGNTIGFIQKAPNEAVPSDAGAGLHVIPGFLHLNRGITMLNLRLSQRWDEAQRAAKIYLRWDIREFGPNSFASISSLLTLSEMEIKEGNTASARDQIDEAVVRIKDLGDIPKQSAIDFARNFGSLLLRVGRYSEAERFFILANRLARDQNRASNKEEELQVRYDELAEAREKLDDLDGASAYRLHSLLMYALSNLESSESFNKESSPKEWIDLIGLFDRTGHEAWSAQLLGFVHDEAKREFARDLTEPLQFPLDLSVFEQTFGSVDRSDLLATALGDLGQVYSWMGRYKEALPLMEQVVKTRQNIYGNGSPQSTESLAVLANELRLFGSYDAALTKAREAFSLALGYSADHGESAIAMSDIVNAPANVLLETAYSQDQTQFAPEAFEVAQYMHSSSAAAALQALGTRLTQSDTASREFIRRQQDLKQQVAQLDAELVASVSGDPKFGNPQREDEIRQNIKSIDADLQKQAATRPSKLDELDEVNDSHPISYHEIAGLLQPDEALINVVVGTDATFVFAATSETLRWVRVDVNDYMLKNMVTTLRCGLDQDSWDDNGCGDLTSTSQIKRGDFDLELSFKLYEQLFAQISDIMETKPRLSMVFTGALNSLPPQVFVTRDPSGKGLHDVDWLVRTHAITLLPSVQSLKILRNKSAQASAPKPLIGFADPTFTTHSMQVVRADESGTQEASRGKVADLTELRLRLGPQLAETADELRQVGTSVRADHADIILGADATETRVKRALLDQYRIVYFATHGLLASDVADFTKLNPEPALVLSLPEHPTEFDDGLLTASEIAELDLNADWVVLSACNTAAGDKPDAEAFSGLARAFFYAGARSIVVSNWEVETKSAVALMSGTFAALAADQRLSHGEALQKSMLQMIDDGDHPEWANPRYWAPFVVVGEPAKPADLIGSR